VRGGEGRARARLAETEKGSEGGEGRAKAGEGVLKHAHQRTLASRG